MIYYHDLDPFIIQFTNSFGIRWYSMAYILGIVFAYYAGQFLIQKKYLNLPEEKLGDIVFFGAMGAVIGGRIGFCLFYNPELLVSFDKSFPFWGLLKVHEGGMASHGGILGFLISQMIYTYRYKISFYALMDLGAIAGAFGIFLGRIANFINGELYGRVVEGSTWLSVRFPGEILLWASDPSTYKKELISLKEIVPSLNSALLSIPSPEIWVEWVSKAAINKDSVFFNYVTYTSQLLYQSAYSIPFKEKLEPLLSLRYPSQLYQSFFGGLLPLIIIVLIWLSKARKPGLISLVFIVNYLFFRIFTEFYRQPDSYIGFQIFNLTRGQLLSFMLYSFTILYAYFLYKQPPKGWRS